MCQCWVLVMNESKRDKGPALRELKHAGKGKQKQASRQYNFKFY